MEVEIRPDKYVRNNLTSGFALSFGESIRRSHKGIEVMDKFPGDLGTLLTTNFRVFWYSDTHAGRNISIGFEKVIAVGRRKIYSGEPDETQVLCLLTYDSPFHREYVFKNCNNLYDLDHIKVLLDIFRAYTSTRSYREVLNNCDLIEDGQLKVLPSEEIFACVDGVWNLNYVERPLGTFMLTNIRAVWFAYENETNNLSVPFLCVEKVNCVPTEYGEAFVVEVLEDNKPYGWRFMAETEDNHTRDNTLSKPDLVAYYIVHVLHASNSNVQLPVIPVILDTSEMRG
ncbi:Bardet-Biedl syndrome 5 protein homolog [Schistocerca piceifrons]|uniref:Bardet-Biedl syndrome 5 protein homolog n=1 Tax=Schistocerca piceifrons TaxID=274613 RepID=UPI001F5E8AFF|nr:Bardet-Biedl syndrome 5 protein homolog [Schistocerca piceifrons]